VVVEAAAIDGNEKSILGGSVPRWYVAVEDAAIEGPLAATHRL